MLRYTTTILAILSFLGYKNEAIGQKLLIINGGVFGAGAGNNTNVAIYDPSNSSYTVIDTIGVNSAQDVHVENDSFAYVAAQDSIIKYDLISGQRLAATAFNAPSTVRLKTYRDKLLVGNWYAPFGQVGNYTNNLRIYDKNSLVYIDSIPEVVKGATDFLIVGDTAYIAQNTNNSSSNFTDTLGYLSVVDLNTMSWVRNDTLAQNGEDLGRLQLVDGFLVAINGVSNSLSYYEILNPSNRFTQAAAADLQPILLGNSVYLDTLQDYYLPFNDAIGRYNLSTNSVSQNGLINHGQTIPFSTSFAYAYDPYGKLFYLSKVFYSSQSSNYGVIYDLQGDSVGTFPVGYSPEVLALYELNRPVSVQKLADNASVRLFPNPSSDFVRVQLADFSPNQTQQLYLYNSAGQLLQQQALQADNLLDISNLPAGLYWLQLDSRAGLRAIIKQ